MARIDRLILMPGWTGVIPASEPRRYTMMEQRLHFGGCEFLQASETEVYALLTDLSQMAPAFPELVSWRNLDDCMAECIVRPGIAMLRGTVRVLIRLEPTEPPRAARARIAAKGLGAEAEAESTFRLSAVGQGTQLDWSAQVTSLRGLAALMSPGILRLAAEHSVARVIEHLHHQLDQPGHER